MPEDNLINDIPGDNTHQGGEGVDAFVFGPGYKNDDTITDFTNGQDHIDLTRFAGITRFEDLSVTSDDGGVTIDLTAHGGGTIRIEGFDIENLDAEDFVFSPARRRRHLGRRRSSGRRRRRPDRGRRGRRHDYRRRR